MKTTRYFDHSRSHPDRQEIRDEWILAAIRDPVEEKIQADGRISLVRPGSAVKGAIGVSITREWVDQAASPAWCGLTD